MPTGSILELKSKDVKETMKAIKEDLYNRFHHQETSEIIDKRVGKRLI